MERIRLLAKDDRPASIRAGMNANGITSARVFDGGGRTKARRAVGERVVHPPWRATRSRWPSGPPTDQEGVAGVAG